MHNSYYLLEPLARQLHPIIKGLEVAAIFSQDKDELVIAFQKADSSFYLKAIMTQEISILTFPDQMKRARKNSIDLFTNVIGAPVESVLSFDHERCLGIRLNNNRTLVFKMFGRQANFLMYDGQKVIALFKNQLKKDWQLSWDQLQKNEPESFEAFEKYEYNYLKAFPTFGARVLPFLKRRSYDQVNPQNQWAILQELKQALQRPIYSLIQAGPEYRLYLLPTDNPIQRYADPISALNGFYRHFIKYYSFTKMQKASLKQLSKKRKQIETAIAKAKQRLSQLDQTSSKEIGDLIMAYMHKIPSRATQIELPNFYNHEPVTIKLKKDLTPQANAANYYRKAKNQKIEQQQLEQTAAQKAGVLVLLQQQIDTINQIQDIQELKEYLKDQKLVQKGKHLEKAIPFRSFVFMGYTIWIGKSATNNDLLTQKYARKNDLWLHAKDVSGSHVVVKHQGNNFPKPVIERAASLAAYYSKRKHESLCPVAYTQKKYVRKPKGSPAGQVLLQQEKVILVKPEI